MSKHPTSETVHPRRNGSVSVAAGVGLFLLLAMPVYALSRLSSSVDWRLLAGIPLALSAFSFLAYRSDKRRAETGRRRTPEFTLHLAELAGGWPGAFLAQRIFRHKIAKTSYQITFWIIVLLHELAAFDALSNWRLARSALPFIFNSR